MKRTAQKVLFLCTLFLFIGLLSAAASTININSQYYQASYCVIPLPPAQSSELLVIGIYTASGTANVKVLNKGSSNVTLVLSAFDKTLWNLTVDPGVTINEIILNGYYPQSTTITDTSGNPVTNIPIIDKSGPNYLGSYAYAWPSTTGGSDTPGLISKVEALTGLKLTAFAGAYYANDFTVNVDMIDFPIANAGADQAVLAGSDGFANVSLDGSGSHAVNNQALTYRWSWSINGVQNQAQGVNPTIQLPVGEHTVQLIVNDGYFDSSPVSVNISVIPSQPPQGEGYTYTAVVTADNYYAIYTGTPENLTFVGKYVSDSFCAPGTFTFKTKPGDYIYVAAWNSVTTGSPGPKAWLGQFVSDAGTILSNTTDWDVYLTFDLSAIAGNTAPSVDTIMADLANATWGPVKYATNHSPNTIWGSMCGGTGYITGIDHSAKWIWGSSMSQYNNYGDYQIFRTKVPSLPIANAGANQTVRVGSPVILDGSGSSDPSNNNPLSYSWSFVPAGSDNPTLSDPLSANPTFVANKNGDYNLKLVVTNSLGVKSAPAYVIVSTYNTAPVAEAGTDQALTRRGTSVQLDGSQSYDPDGDSITYSWSVDSAPEGSTATISNPGTAKPTFAPDVYGDYVLKLRVNDQWGAVGDDAVKLSFENLAPEANAQSNQSIILGESAVFDGSLSSDPNGDPLTYLWNTISTPQGSKETLVNVTAIQGSFTPDLPGTFILGLVVNDGQLSSSSSNITIEVVTRRTAAINAVKAAIDYINNLYQINPRAFKNRIMADAMTKELNLAVGMLDKRLTIPAMVILYNTLEKTDGKPFPADYIVDKTAQAEMYALILNAINILNNK